MEYEEFGVFKKMSPIIIVAESVDIKSELLLLKDQDLGEYLEKIFKRVKEKQKFTIPDEIARPFADVNKKESIVPLPKESKSIKIISKRQLDKILNDAGLYGFNKKFPNSGGYLAFSNVGFNPNYTQALIYFSRYVAENSAGGTIVFLEKESDVWKVKFFKLLWVS